MIKLIVGSKGSGKTKVLIDLVNKAAETSTGSVVCIEKAMNLNFSIKPSVRLVHADDYDINGYDQFYGFICGVLAGNYDITDIFVDGIVRIGNRDLDALATMVEKVQGIVKDDVAITLTVSTDPENLPESLKAYL